MNGNADTKLSFKQAVDQLGSPGNMKAAVLHGFVQTMLSETRILAVVTVKHARTWGTDDTCDV